MNTKNTKTKTPAPTPAPKTEADALRESIEKTHERLRRGISGGPIPPPADPHPADCPICTGDSPEPAPPPDPVSTAFDNVKLLIPTFAPAIEELVRSPRSLRFLADLLDVAADHVEQKNRDYDEREAADLTFVPGDIADREPVTHRKRRRFRRAD